MDKFIKIVKKVDGVEHAFIVKYHSNDEISALAYINECANDPSHPLDIIDLMIVSNDIGIYTPKIMKISDDPSKET